MGRLLRPVDVAATVGHLLSDASAMMTGTIVDLHPEMASDFDHTKRQRYHTYVASICPGDVVCHVGFPPVWGGRWVVCLPGFVRGRVTPCLKRSHGSAREGETLASEPHERVRVFDLSVGKKRSTSKTPRIARYSRMSKRFVK